MKRILLVVFLALLVPMAFAKIKTVYLIPFSHQDIGFTSTQEEVAWEYVDMYDSLKDFMDFFGDFKFTVETFWQFDQWMQKSDSPELLTDYIELARKGRLEICPAYGSMHTGFTNEFTLRAAFYKALDFLAENGIEAKTCMMNDVPGFSADLPDVLSELGISYFMSGINDNYADALSLPLPVNLFYWKGPNGGRVLTWISKSSYAEGYKFKTPSALINYIHSLEEAGYPYDAIAVMVAFDNAGFQPGAVAYLDLYEKWDTQSAGFQLIMSTPSEFMEYMETHYANGLPEYSGDWSGWWEIVKTGSPYASALVRRSQEIMESLQRQNLIDQSNELFQIITDNLVLYGEHTAACGAGWPGYYTLEENKEFNTTVMSYAKGAWNALKSILHSLRSKGSRNISFLALQDGISQVEFSIGNWNENELLLISKDEITYKAYPFTREATDLWEPLSRGYRTIVPLSKGLNDFEIVGKQPFQNNAKNSLSAKKGDLKLIINPDGSFTLLNKDNILAKGSVEEDFTSKAERYEQVEMSVHESVLKSFPEWESLYVKLKGSPIAFFEATLFNNGNLEFSITLDRNKLPYIEYKNHSVNYYLKLDFPEGYKMSYRGASSIQKDPKKFPSSRPTFIAFRDFIGLSGSLNCITMGSRQAFMVSRKGQSLRYLLIRHYSEFASSDRGITAIGEVEPGAPRFMKYTFFISVSDSLSPQKAESFVNSPLLISSDR
ncbi:hypothetical protein AT15_05595 [Kosmotoga arenicorallina S304]|uniref:Glycoside hydrolase family 38 N-terminal domain-containing protein n=1 Tax=Kosmotoga arenicorallina S304 TaxID=1453497 RepID=A0A176K3H6_9BACT|nr:hypothetical protein [Kosmotoga arenicorallina]OAA31547.1 hypothetical protein AT15_05595 [Kosmotoga arenicorallina S304]